MRVLPTYTTMSWVKIQVSSQQCLVCPGHHSPLPALASPPPAATFTPSSCPCLQEEDEPEAAAEGDEEGGDGFFVDDGYFSEDEGVRAGRFGG